MCKDELFLEHMAVWDRNERLYETLKGWGLFVTAVMREDNLEKIDHLVISAGLPTVESFTAQQAIVLFGVGTPVQRSKVVDGVAPASSGGDNVINFPTVV